MIEINNKVPENMQTAMAYGISKNFVNWRAKHDAGRLGDKGIRVVSVSHGKFETPMGALESEDGKKYIQACAIKRFGYPEEIAYLFSTIVDERNGYLTATDIICDGGMIGFGLEKIKK
ncbi:SDR family oxidoreductase [Lacrimispora sp. 38-1]|uniref:SDR family oxidoreductase n=1 Tax=Lacrimispora sp. 38-1 TaxID=3125778 RepID=UPI003CFBBA4D